MILGLHRLLPNTLRRQLILGVALVHAVLMTLFIWDLTARQKEMLLERQTELAQALAGSMAASSAGWVSARDYYGLQEIVTAQRRYPEFLFAMILDRDGRILAHSDMARLGQYVRDLPPQAKPALISRGAILVDAVNPVFLGDTHLGWTRVGLSQKGASTQLARVTREGALYALAAIVIGALLAWAMGHRLTRRLHAIQAVADRVQAGEETCRAVVAGEDEAARLAHAFNTMLDSLARSRKELLAHREHLEELVGNRTAELRENQRQLEAIIENLPAIFFTKDAEGRHLMVNRRYEEGVGINRERVIGCTDREIFPAETAETIQERDRQVLAGRTPVTFEERVPHPDGVWHDYLTTKVPLLDETGRACALIGIATDITPLKLLQKDLALAKEEAERNARAKSEFLANMSHEIRTPLNAVLGLARIGARDHAGHAETYTRILEAGEHLLGVINDILDISRLEAGKLAVETHPFPLSATLANAVGLLAGAARQKNLAFAVERAPDLPDWVQGDARRLQQILVNLLSNAVKFTQAGEVRLRVTRAGGEILFCVIDTGIGMDPNQAARLFQPFEQADNSTTRKYGGSGLGLAISRNLAHLMGGDIRLESAPGRGSAFTLRLPLPETGPEPEETHPAGERRGSRLAGLRVLVAEDMEINRFILADLLAHEGARAVFAEQGLQALERLEAAGADAFDIVLMDVQMPVMDGYEAARRIKEKAPGLPVIGLTAHALAEERKHCLDAGMADHITKPIDPDALIAAIRRLTGGVTPAPDARAETGANLRPASEAEADQAPSLDWAALLARHAGREAFVEKLVALALNALPASLEKLRTATRQNDLAALRIEAHTLKGACGNLLARRAAELARRTEQAAHDLAPASAALSQELAQSLQDLLAELRLRAGE
ncbi:MAG: response regulator [Betaproteobacteria bacterium]|nr:response regulator [Betaproteobacteria bacterium]